MAVTNLDEFNAALREWAEIRVPTEVAHVMRLISLEALSRVILKTPVDTGRTRANWQVSLETPLEGQVEIKDRDGTRTISRGKTIIEKAPAYSIVWLANNVDWIEVLENGGYEPKNPSNDQDSMKKRAWGRSKARRRQALAELGNEGATFVRDGYSMKAPHGMVQLAFEELKTIFR